MNLARHSRKQNGSHRGAGREKKFEIYGFHARKLLKNIGAFLQFPIFFTTAEFAEKRDDTMLHILREGVKES